MFRAALALRRSTTTTSSLTETLSHQLLQRCPVSGTAKGKAKIKAQTLTRSKVTIKKGAPSAPASPPTTGVLREQEEMIDKCLAAPTPIRFLKPKQKAREAQREKLGLVSKERQREIEILKKQAKEGTGFEKPLRMGTEGFDLITLGLVDEDQIPKYELTVEDGKRLAKEYSRVLMRKHRSRQKAETGLLRMKKEAIAALPEGLREKALVPDLEKFPANRFMATLTPPIEGHLEMVMAAAKKTSGKAKLR